MYKVYVLLNTLRSLPELLTFVDKFKPGTAWNNNINREADCVTKLQVYVTDGVCSNLRCQFWHDQSEDTGKH